MKTTRIATLTSLGRPTPWLALLAGTLLASPLAAQNFNNGSTGALGDVVIDSDTTVALPPDGILHYRSLRVNAGSTLRFTRNEHNTPVYLLSQGDVVIAGMIDVSGQGAPINIPTGGAGGPGGFDGGKPGFAETPPGAGYGPGGGRGGAGDSHHPNGAGSGSYATVNQVWGNTNKGAVYGSKLLIPLVGGSGGGGRAGAPGQGGGGGGGAVLISSNTRLELTGTVRAQGGNPGGLSGNGGSGGAVRLVAPVVAGNGTVAVNTPNNWAGDGRIRVDTIDRRELQLVFQPLSSLSMGANLFIFPPNEPRLDVVQVAGQAIPVGSAPVTFQLPFGADPNQVVRVQARDWNRVVPIRVVLTPDSGDPVQFDAEINNAAQNPAVAEVPVTVPVNTPVTVHCWTR
ncbi:MAG: hypothetical protein IPM17_08520 [Verrucomicrobia bacterium]|nr:hypothetical protein [Verrucomicrobiota bacterium]